MSGSGQEPPQVIPGTAGLHKKIYLKGRKEKKIMLEKIKEIVAESLNVDAEGLTAETSFKDDLGADSLDLFQIIMGIEEEFDIEISTKVVEKIVSVGDAVEQIKLAIG